MIGRNAEVDAKLRAELHLHGDHWRKEHNAMGEEQRKELLDNLIAKRKADPQRLEYPELRGDYSGKPVGGTLQHGTGGGHRVIRSTKPFS